MARGGSPGYPFRMGVLGLDIGGANLKAATADKRAVSVPFALWKQPDRLPAALADLVAQFPDAEALAVTMTGELCDCFRTKRDGVNAIITAVLNVSRSRPVWVWSTDGEFLDSERARQDYMKVAAANWHALATLAGQYAPEGAAVLIDVGSTTTDVIPILDGIPIPRGRTDTERLDNRELVYTGVRRTPVAVLVEDRFAAELFATTLDAYLHLNMVPEDPTDTDTADGRPATRDHAFDRLCRMYCGDRETVPALHIDRLAGNVMQRQVAMISRAFDYAWYAIEEQIDSRHTAEQKGAITVIVGGSGEFLAGCVSGEYQGKRTFLSLTDRLGPTVSACAPAYAVAVLKAGQPPKSAKRLPWLPR